MTFYSCSVNPTIPGRLYCSGTRPGGPGRLQVGIRQGSSPPTYNYFLDWPSTVAGIESCAPTSASAGPGTVLQLYDQGSVPQTDAVGVRGIHGGTCFAKPSYREDVRIRSAFGRSWLVKPLL